MTDTPRCPTHPDAALSPIPDGAGGKTFVCHACEGWEDKPFPPEEDA